MKTKTALVVWFTGLPGSGKSTISEIVARRLKKLQNQVTLVSMDAIRKNIYPKPTYSDEERDAAYRALVLIAVFLSRAGNIVLLDATGHKLVWRKLARRMCPNFAEIYVRCPVEICIKRETERNNNNMVRKKLYLSALKRLREKKKIGGIGKVPGVDEPYEESSMPEIVLDTSYTKPQVLAELVLRKLGIGLRRRRLKTEV